MHTCRVYIYICRSLQLAPWLQRLVEGDWSYWEWQLSDCHRRSGTCGTRRGRKRNWGARSLRRWLSRLNARVNKTIFWSFENDVTNSVTTIHCLLATRFEWAECLGWILSSLFSFRVDLGWREIKLSKSYIMMDRWKQVHKKHEVLKHWCTLTTITKIADCVHWGKCWVLNGNNMAKTPKWSI